MNKAPVTREQAIDNAVRILIAGVALQASRSPREAAEAAWYPGHELGTVEAIEAEIVLMRAEDVELIAAMDAKAKTTRRVA